MTAQLPAESIELRSLVGSDGVLELSLQPVPLRDLGADEVLIRVEGTPINPSDLGLLLAGADLARAEQTRNAYGPVVRVQLPPAQTAMLAARHGQSLPVGNEGAGTVIAAGSGAAAQALLGRTVATVGGAMYASHRITKAIACLPLPAGTTAAQGASCFVNPLTALGMVETMRREGHSALVHTAAASNLGQMLLRICQADGIQLVNIVRRQEQAELLRSQGAAHVCVTADADFDGALTEALVATGATIAFDAIGGGTLAGRILAAMEAAANRNATEYSRYGSSVYKQVYIYGALDRGPTELARNFGFSWGLGGWLLTPFLQKIGLEAAQGLRQRVAAEITTTFASHYTRTVSLAGALDLAEIAVYAKQATGTKYLIDPSMG